MVAAGVWRPGCPVGRDDLRRLDVNFVDFSGNVQRGVLIANLEAPNLTVHNLRGGARFVFNASDYTFTLASYQTMFDLPAVRFRGAQSSDAGFIPGVTSLTADTYAPLVWVK